MMFSRFILRTTRESSFEVLLSLSPSVRLRQHVLDVGLSFGRFHAVFTAGWTASVVDDLVQVGLDDLCL